MAYDVIIIGAGPAGLTAGIYARSKMMSTLILESGKVGGQLVALYPEKGIHNYPGYETVQARKRAMPTAPLALGLPQTIRPSMALSCSLQYSRTIREPMLWPNR